MLRILSLTLLATTVLACVSDDHVVVIREASARTSGVAPTALRPRATGPLLRDGGTAFSFGAFGAPRMLHSEANVSSADTGAMAGLARGWRDADLQLSGELRPARLARRNGARGPLSTGLFDGQDTGWASLGGRVRMLDTGRLSLVLISELGIGWGHVERLVTERRTTVVDRATGEHEEWTSDLTIRESGLRIGMGLVGGVAAHWWLRHDLGVELGLATGLEPVIAPESSVVETCVTPSGSSTTDCTGTAPEHISSYQYVGTFLPHVGVTLSLLDGLNVSGRIYSSLSNTLGSDFAGGELTVRLSI